MTLITAIIVGIIIASVATLAINALYSAPTHLEDDDDWIC